MFKGYRFLRAKINNVHKDEPDTFDYVKVNVLDDKTRNGNNCTVRYKVFLSYMARQRKNAHKNSCGFYHTLYILFFVGIGKNSSFIASLIHVQVFSPYLVGISCSVLNLAYICLCYSDFS